MSNMVPESHPFLPLYRLYGQHALTIDMADIEGHYMKHERRCFWVAVLPDTNEVVGCVALEPHASDSGIVPIEPSEIGPDGRALRIAELRRMSVSAAHRGKQIATRLLDRTSEWARANGFTSIRLTCSEFQYAAIQLYERYGYKACRSAAVSRSLSISCVGLSVCVCVCSYGMDG